MQPTYVNLEIQIHNLQLDLQRLADDAHFIPWIQKHDELRTSNRKDLATLAKSDAETVPLNELSVERIWKIWDFGVRRYDNDE